MDPVTFIGDVLSGIESAVVSMGPSPWLLLAVLLLCYVDGFFPPVPSESIVIGVATLSVTGQVPPLYLGVLVLVAAIGAFFGDLTAYKIGSRVPLERLRMFRGRRGRASLAKAADLLDRRGTAVILSGRFIPVGRIAVNVTAGAVGYPRARYLPTAAGAAVLWAAYSAAMGIGAGHLLRDSPLLAMTLGITAGALVGLLIDKLVSRVRSMFGSMRRSSSASPGEAPRDAEPEAKRSERLR
ncbi:DedA family protein [Glycomyces salinus]|uniref:DedA family protein n=1 Tax=Glycomyces salinus TaxID=980294 RepID=UPI0018EA9564|nr:VTT domain-containing protein [Glycomyces salinus]